jgi:dienelactone hydrolase
MIRLTTLLALLTLGVAMRADAAGTQVSFPPVGQPSTPGAIVPAAIPGMLSLPPPSPASGGGKGGGVPAVVIAHASGGLTPLGPEQDYVAAFNDAGIAALVIDMWAPRQVPSGAAAFGGDGGADRRPRAISDTLPDAFGALKFLAAHPAIDRKRIGIMGFSWGGMLSVLAMLDGPAERALGADFRFAAHSAHWLVCSLFASAGPMAAAMRAKWTEVPLQLQVGGQDDYDNADGGATCRALIAGLPPEKQRHVELIVYPEATHAWEEKLPFPINIRDPRQGNVRIAPDPDASARARASTVAFFKAVFAMPE